MNQVGHVVQINLGATSPTQVSYWLRQVGTLNSPVWEYSSNGSTGWATVLNGTPTNAVYTDEATATLGVSGNIAAGTYYYRRYLTPNAEGCDATSTTVTLTVGALPNAATINTVTDPN